MPHPIYVFDAYGTLFDVHSAVARHRDAIGPRADRLSETWRRKQLEYTWVRSLAGIYRDFWSCTRDALDFAAADAGGIPADTRAKLLSAYESLGAYADAQPALAALKAQGARTAILSNGTPHMLNVAVRSASLGEYLDAILSVDGIHIYKTDPRAYRLVTDRFQCGREAVSFQSSNRWDVAGAATFGFRAVWINRSGAPDEYLDAPPALVVSGLADLIAQA
ncbi:MAG: haloacid dehalogenase type II [Methylobacteriaceae bacterium]|nr:haloacid dehalogenase type II [Methylobacteriaceae bacterium]